MDLQYISFVADLLVHSASGLSIICILLKVTQDNTACAFFLQVPSNITYLPHKAVAEVSKDKEPIGRECAEFNWFESQSTSDSNELRVK